MELWRQAFARRHGDRNGQRLRGDVDHRVGPDHPAPTTPATNATETTVVTQAGDLVPGRSFVEADDNWVLITFDKNIVEAADGFVSDAGAAQDFAGHASPAGSL